MEIAWFFLEGHERRGPLTTEQLVAKLLTTPSPHKVLVWHQELREWQEAGTVAEIAQRLPPPKPGVLSSAVRPPVPLADAEAIASLYRNLVLLVGLQYLLSLVQLPAELLPFRAAPWLLLGASVAVLGSLVAIAVVAYQLSGRLGSNLSVLWAVVMFLPCLNVIGLLALSSKAQTWCRQYGIRVGLLGPTRESLDQLRRRAA